MNIQVGIFVLSVKRAFKNRFWVSSHQASPELSHHSAVQTPQRARNACRGFDQLSCLYDISQTISNNVVIEVSVILVLVPAVALMDAEILVENSPASAASSTCGPATYH